MDYWELNLLQKNINEFTKCSNLLLKLKKRECLNNIFLITLFCK